MQSYKIKMIYAIILLTFNKLIIILFRNFQNINIAVPQKCVKVGKQKKPPTHHEQVTILDPKIRQLNNNFKLYMA